MKRNHIFDTSEELLVERWRTGVKLTRPDNFHSFLNEMKPPSVKQLFEMPFNVYFLNTQSVIQNMSETTAHVCGFQGRKDAIGKTARAVSKKNSAEFSIKHNNEVISSHSIVIKDEHFQRLDDFEFRDIAIKFPLFNADGKIIGVFGCSLIVDLLAQAFNHLMQTGLLVPANIYEKNRHYYFNSDTEQYNLDNLNKKLTEKSKQYISKRETECLFHLMRGKSARETGMQLNLSQRTVEYYLNSLKEKLHCAKKSELIEIVFNLLRN